MFFAEGATLAHVVRPLALARGLDAELFDVTFCRPHAFRWLTTDAGFPVRDLPAQDGFVFARNLKYGRPLYSYRTLARYVEDDLALIDCLQPDAIVGDFRLSLSVSARLRSVPYLTICDAYWSPERPLNAVLPVLGFTRYVPQSVAKWVFRRVSRLALGIHAVPMERLRKRYGLPGFGFDIRRCYSDADVRLFANFPLLFPEMGNLAEAAFVGPITWFPEITTNLDFLNNDDSIVYVTMGSSGDSSLLEKIVPVLEKIGATVVVATAGKSVFKSHSKKTRVFDFLPGNVVCKKARLVICNGGSPATSQALANGVPVLGIAANMDQFLNMQTIEAFGAGLLVRADCVSAEIIDKAVSRLLQDTAFRDRARELAASAFTYDGASFLAQQISLLTSVGSADVVC